MAEYAATDRSLHYNHFSNGVVSDLQNELSEVNECISHAITFGDQEFQANMESDRDRLIKALSVYD